jgi:hypothetical protein
VTPFLNVKDALRRPEVLGRYVPSATQISSPETAAASAAVRPPAPEYASAQLEPLLVRAGYWQMPNCSAFVRFVVNASLRVAAPVLRVDLLAHHERAAGTAPLAM